MSTSQKGLVVALMVLLCFAANRRHQTLTNPSSSQRMTTPGLILTQAIQERQLEGRLYWDVANRIRSGELNTEAKIIESLQSRIVFAEGESRIYLDQELNSICGWDAVSKAAKEGENVGELQLNRYAQVFEEWALEGDPTITDSRGGKVLEQSRGARPQ